MGFQDKGVCLRMSHNVYAQHKNEIWHTATYCSNSGISKREYYGEKETLSDFIKQRNANSKNSATIVTEASSKLIKVCLFQSY